ncbi:MAG: alpha/beta hydrolase [Anaerolineae bacterium]|nr:alpha/beta hydrolase [Anaerolineae bacterium]
MTKDNAIDPEWKVKVVMAMMHKAGFTSWSDYTVAEARAFNNQARNPLMDLFFGKPIALPFVEDVTMVGRTGPIAGRVYRPNTNRSLPMLVYFHGGGWTIGNLDSHDKNCRRIAHEAQRLVFAVDYRLAPEHKFPAAVDDAVDAVAWVAEHGSRFGGIPDNIAVAGDSAGGNLAAVVCQLARDAGGPSIAQQVLIYPATDMSRVYASEETYADAPMLSRKDMHWYYTHYLNSDADKRDARCSPLLGRLHDLPPALIMTAEFDAILDQGRIYAEALQAYGNTVVYKMYPRQIHGFLSLAGLSGQADVAFADMARFLQG